MIFICAKHPMDNNFDLQITAFMKKYSLESLRSNPKYLFEHLKIPIATQHNDGQIGQFLNKCCFLSIYHGLQKLGIEYSNNGIEITPYSLLQLANFIEQYTMIDTDNANHVKCLVNLIGQLHDIQLQFFIGEYNNDKDQWMTTPDPQVVVGTGSQIIRVLNMRAHFELIVTNDNNFIATDAKVNVEFVIQQQYDVSKVIDVEKKKKMEEDDRKYALEVEKMEKQIREDELFAMQLENNSN